jgi:hypothetical protein
MDEITTNINVTCDMLTNIITNLITLTENTSQVPSLKNALGVEQLCLEVGMPKRVSDSELIKNDNDSEKR